MSASWSGQSVVVTGATGAIGAVVAAKLRQEGARVTAPVRSLDRVPASLRHDDVHLVAGVDLRDEADVARVYQEAHDTHGPLWASLHVAGGFDMAPVVDTELGALRHLLDMNAITSFLCCREAARRMGDAGGRLVNVAARPVLVPTAGVAAYAMSKAAVAGLTHSLSEELAPRGIWVNAVVPSLVDTPRNRADMPDATHADWPTPEEVAEVMVFLASPANRVARGALVPVYGRS